MMAVLFLEIMLGTNMKVGWLIDIDLMAEEQVGIIPHLKSLGYPVYKLSAALDKPKIKHDPEYVYAFLGSFEELDSVKKHLGFPIATYGLNKYINRSGYISFMPNDWFLNEHSVMATWGQLQHNSTRFFKMFDSEQLFARPDDGKKSFTGQVFNKSSIFDEMQFLDRYSRVAPETLIWVGESKKIDREYRFWISAGKVLTWSEYSWDKTPIQTIVEPTKAICDMAEQVAKYDWQVDLIYTVDITEHDGTAKIIELNSFSCAGLYNCDGKNLLEVVSRDILDEWND